MPKEHDMKTRIQDLVLNDSTVVASESVLSQNIGGETVLLQIESGEYYGLNEVGSRIWTLLQEGNSTREVLTTLVSEYGVAEEALSSDIGQFLRDLQDKGLIQINACNSA